jgi:hypothetical protein
MSEQLFSTFNILKQESTVVDKNLIRERCGFIAYLCYLSLITFL